MAQGYLATLPIGQQLAHIANHFDSRNDPLADAAAGALRQTLSDFGLDPLTGAQPPRSKPVRDGDW